MWRRLTAWLLAPFRFFFGDDIFISYARKDGINYAEGLAAKLAERKLSCRVDLWETIPGKELPPRLKRALRWSKMLVLVATKGAADSPSVEKEIREFLVTGGTIVPVDLDGTLETAPWFGVLRGLPIARETDRHVITTGQPAEGTVSRIVNSVTFTRRNRRIQYAALVSAAVLLGAAGWSIERTLAAARQQKLANDARTEAEKQTQIAADRKREASAMAKNTVISEMKLNATGGARRRAVQAIRAWREYPNMRSVQLLADALGSANHPVRRHVVPESNPVVSANGMYVASWRHLTHEVFVYHLGAELERRWSAEVSDLPGVPPPIDALAVSGDGRMVAVNVRGKDGALLIILRATPAADGTFSIEELMRDRGDAGGSRSFDQLRVTPDGQYLWGLQEVLASEDRVVGAVVYRIGKAVSKLQVPVPKSTVALRDVQVSPDSRHVAILTVSRDFTTAISVFALPDLKPVTALVGREAHLETLTFAPDKDTMLVTSHQTLEQLGHFYTLIERWPSSDRKITRIQIAGLSPEFNERTAIFLPNSPCIILVPALHLRRDATQQWPRPIAPIACGYDGYPEVAGTIDNTGRDLDREINSGDITSVGFRSEDGSLVVTDLGGRVTSWEPFFRFGAPHVQLGQVILGLDVPSDGHALLLPWLAFSDPREGVGEAEKIVVTAVSDWKTRTPRLQQTIEVPSRNDYHAISADHRLLATVEYRPTDAGGLDAAVVVRGLDGGERRRLRLGSEVPPATRIVALSFNPEGRFLALVAEEGWTFLWDLQGGDDDPVARLQIDEHPGRSSVAFSRGGEILAFSSGDKIRTYGPINSSSPPMLAEMIASRSGEVVTMAASAEESYLAAGTSDGKVVIWRDWTGEKPTVVRTIAVAKSPQFNAPTAVVSIAFHPVDANVLAVLSQQDLEVYSLLNEDPFIRIPHGNGVVTAMARFSADGRYVISTATGHSSYEFWHWHPDDLIRDACDSFLLDEDLTSAERNDLCKTPPATAPAAPR